MSQLERVLQENNKPRGAFFSVLSPRRAGKSKPPPKPQAAQPAPRAPPGGLCRSSKAHLEALAALAAVDNLSDLDTPDIVRRSHPRPSHPPAAAHSAHASPPHPLAWRPIATCVRRALAGGDWDAVVRQVVADQRAHRL